MNNIQLFEHEKFGQIRTVTDEKGDTWFIARDIAIVLGYVNISRDIQRHCKKVEELKGDSETVLSSSEHGGAIKLLIIPESDLYRLVMRSNLPDAERFQDWVVEEVLPSIRKHGAYMTAETIEEALLNPDTLIKLATNLKEEREKRQALEQKIEENKPKVLFADAVSASDGTILIGSLLKSSKITVSKSDKTASSSG